MNKINITEKQAEKAAKIVTYFGAGYEQCREHVLKLIKKLEKEYDKSIDIDHLKQEVKELKRKIIDFR